MWEPFVLSKELMEKNKNKKKLLELEQNNKTLFINRSHVTGPWRLFWAYYNQNDAQLHK